MSVVLGKPEVPTHWFLDANVLFSEWTRWLMVELARQHQAQLYWTPHIENECYRNLVRLGRLHQDDADRERIALPSRLGAVLLPQAHEPYLADVRPVDEKDRHVAASALALRHQVHSTVGLLTWNVKDFPRKQLLKLGLVRYSPDELFIELKKNRSEAAEALDRTVLLMQSSLQAHNPLHPTVYQSKANPLPSSPADWQSFLARNRMHRTAKLL
ncbi:MAG TPA: PIN domain-containing protein, partial [Limnobacter sp.]|nr:PIN domain-containing protein [Limnobacter sp.]